MTRGRASEDPLALARRIAEVVDGEGRRLARIARRPVRIEAKKLPYDPVTARDVETERRLRRALARLVPGAAFVGEEGGRRGRGTLTWVVDPIDGTSNFAAGLGIFGVAVALLEGTRPVAAACFDARSGETTLAALGRGAWRGRARLRIRGAPANRPGPLALYAASWRVSESVSPLLRAMAPAPGKLRVLGCTVSHLLAVAEGRIAAAVQDRAKLWDVAAAGLIAAEAGAHVVDFAGRDLCPFPADALERTDRDYPFVAGTRAGVREALRRITRHGAA